jgi:alcohol dehydrogenase
MACGDRKAAFRVSILDPELTLSQPRAVTAVTGIDAVAHAIEAFVCTKRNAVSAMCARAAFRHLEPNFERVLRAPHDLKARAEMQVGASCCPTSSASTPRRPTTCTPTSSGRPDWGAAGRRRTCWRRGWPN